MVLYRVKDVDPINKHPYFHFCVELKGPRSRSHRLFQAWKLGQKWVTCALSSCHTVEPNIYGIYAIYMDKKYTRVMQINEGQAFTHNTHLIYIILN